MHFALHLLTCNVPFCKQETASLKWLISFSWKFYLLSEIPCNWMLSCNATMQHVWTRVSLFFLLCRRVLFKFFYEVWSVFVLQWCSLGRAVGVGWLVVFPSAGSNWPCCMLPLSVSVHLLVSRGPALDSSDPAGIQNQCILHIEEISLTALPHKVYFWMSLGKTSWGLPCLLGRTVSRIRLLRIYIGARLLEADKITGADSSSAFQF